MRVLRIFLGTLYPSLCFATVFVIMSMWLDANYSNHNIFPLFTIIALLTLTPALICSLLLEFIINPKIKNHATVMIIGSFLGIFIAVGFIGLAVVVHESYRAYREYIPVMLAAAIIGASLAIVSTAPLRYLFIKGRDYKLLTLLLYLISGFLILIGMCYFSYELSKLIEQLLKAGLPSKRGVV